MRQSAWYHLALLAVLSLVALVLAVSNVMDAALMPGSGQGDAPASAPTPTIEARVRSSPAAFEPPTQTLQQSKALSVIPVRTALRSVVSIGDIATVKVPVADMWKTTHPASDWDRETQAIMGEKVLVVGIQDAWYQVVIPAQPSPKDSRGYPGWIRASDVTLQPYEHERLALVMAPLAPLMAEPSQDAEIIATVSLDTRLGLLSEQGSWLHLALPDGHNAWLHRDAAKVILANEPDIPASVQQILATAKQFFGTKYRWGGTSSAAFDCSGFTYRVLHANGILIPRDSLPQSQRGIAITGDSLQAGDLVFYATGGPGGVVSHVAIYLGDGQVIGTFGTDAVGIGPVDSSRYTKRYWGARRYW